MLKVYYCHWEKVRRFPILNSESKSIRAYTRTIRTKTSLSWRRSVTRSTPLWKTVPKGNWVKPSYEDVDPCQMGKYLSSLVCKLPKRIRDIGYLEVNWVLEESGRFHISVMHFQNPLHHSSGVGHIPEHFATRWPDRITKKFLYSHES